MPPTAKAVRGQRKWLHRSKLPGASRLTPELSRALLDLHALLEPNGAFLAAPVSGWRFVWPRDSAFVAVALADAGHPGDALRILQFLRSVAPVNGRWQARYRPDGSGQPPDGRGVQMDGGALVSWSLWEVSRLAPAALTTAKLRQYFPMVLASTQALVRSIGPDGLPEPSEDYWEKSEQATTIEIAATALLGLRSASHLAAELGQSQLADEWSSYAARLNSAVGRTFGQSSYQRYSTGGGADAAVVFLGPPFAPLSASIDAAVNNSFGQLLQPGGGLDPGRTWKHSGVAWTPETALFGLSAAATGMDLRTRSIESWLSAHTTSLGEVPEQVLKDGSPSSVAPLGWTSALEVLMASESAHPLPIP